jgi:branched-chain amino acid transport system permease protein
VNLKADLPGLALATIVAILVPFAFRSAALLGILAVMFIWMAVNVSWNLVLGFAGTFSFGQLAFFVCGGYTSGILDVHYGVSPWIDTLAAAGTGAAASLVIGLAVLRLRGVYVALVTLAFHQLVNSLVSNDYSGLTGGPNGLTPIRPYFESTSLLGQSLVGYWIGLVCALGSTIVILLILRSPIGLALVAARDAEHVASARGVMATRYRMIAFVVSGAIAGLMGGVYAHFIGVVSPSLFNFGLLMMLFSMIIVGGWGTVWGPIVGTITITALSEWIDGRWPQYEPLILAAVMVSVVLFLQGGIVGAAQLAIRRAVLAWERLE